MGINLLNGVQKEVCGSINSGWYVYESMYISVDFSKLLGYLELIKI